MDERGHIYEGPRKSETDVEVDAKSVPALKNMPRRSRRAYFSEKRRGASEEQAMDAARKRISR